MSARNMQYKGKYNESEARAFYENVSGTVSAVKRADRDKMRRLAKNAKFQKFSTFSAVVYEVYTKRVKGLKRKVSAKVTRFVGLYNNSVRARNKRLLVRIECAYLSIREITLGGKSRLFEWIVAHAPSTTDVGRVLLQPLFREHMRDNKENEKE